MVPTYSKHGPDMVLKSRHLVDIGLRPWGFSLENFRALAYLEVKLHQISAMADKCIYLPEGQNQSGGESVRLGIRELTLRAS